MDYLSESEMELNYDEEPEIDKGPIQYSSYRIDDNDDEEQDDYLNEPVVVPNDSPKQQQQQPEEPNSSIDLCAEDLFGDIDDVDEDFEFTTAYSEAESIVSKKQKMSDEQIRLGMVEQILETRRKYRESQNFSLARSNAAGTEVWAARVKQFGVNLSATVPSWPSIQLRNECGELVYVRFHSREFLQTKMDEIGRDLQSQSFVDNSDELWKQANLILAKQSSVVCKSSAKTQPNRDLESKKELWTSFYKPKLYIELLSDEMINRALLKWIKLWDFEVFKKSLSLYDSGETNADTQNAAKTNDKWKKFQKQQVPLKLDASNRPEFKVALLCGPPGIGKTTMAYLIASKAGYNVIEVNASDERTVEAFQTVLENATQMQSLAAFNPKPNCIVLDEIDGAPQQTVEYLLKFIADTKTVSGAKQRKGAKKNYLRRPIICICNDVYAPALRSLRQVAYQINFQEISKNRLSERLLEVCQKEGIQTDRITLSTLCEKTNNDIRSCLTFLYFFKNNSHAKKYLNLSDIQQSDIGEKDFKSDLFGVWRKIFYLDRTQKKSLANRARDVNKAIENINEYQKLMLGVFENYLVFVENLSLASDSLIEAIGTFSFHDFLQTNIDKYQNFHLSAYLSRSFRIWHFAFATFNHRFRITFPTNFNEVYKKILNTNSIVDEFLAKNIPAKLKPLISRNNLLMDWIPYLTMLIKPQNIRGLNLNLFTTNERKELDRVLKTMHTFGLTYVQEKSNQEYQFKLEPSIDEVVQFADVWQKMTGDASEKLPQPTFNYKTYVNYSNRQLIARELEFMKVSTNQAKDSDVTVTKTVQNRAIKNEPIAPINKIQALKRDFFGRIIPVQPISPKTAAKQLAEKRSQPHFWFQFKEGYSNAVRTDVILQDLI